MMRAHVRWLCGTSCWLFSTYDWNWRMPAAAGVRFLAAHWQIHSVDCCDAVRPAIWAFGGMRTRMGPAAQCDSIGMPAKATKRRHCDT